MPRKRHPNDAYEHLREEAISLLESDGNLTYREVAKRLNVDHVTIAVWWKNSGKERPARTVRKVRVPDARWRDAVRRLQEDPTLSQEQVAAELGVSAGAVSIWMRKAGASRPTSAKRAHPGESRSAMARQMLAAGERPADIAKKLGITRQAVSEAKKSRRAKVDYLLAPFADVIREHCRHNDFTIDDLARRLKCSKNTIKQWVAKEGTPSHRECSLEHVVRFALAKGI